MRSNIVLALVLTISGLVLCTLFFVFLNVQIPQEPFSLWSELPYAGMFQYAGIICLAGAVIYLLMETEVSIVVNTKNMAMISVVILANFASLLLGGYYALTPVFFLIGLVCTSVIGAWISIGMRTKDLLSLIAVATFVAAIDEYAHTSVGTLTYFDNAVPSALTVSGWSLFTILLLTVTKIIMRVRLLNIPDRKVLRTVPALLSTILVFAIALFQGYTSVFDWLLVLVYSMLVLASFYYTYAHSLKWNVLLMIVSLAFGAGMEYIGRWEGLWTFRFMEPLSLLILFSWPLRIWTIGAFCFILNVDFANSLENQRPATSVEFDKQNELD